MPRQKINAFHLKVGTKLESQAFAMTKMWLKII